MAVSNWSASVISGLSSDTEPTIVVTFDSAKYIFNAGENTGRSWLQSRNNWKKAKGLFFTSVGTQRMSGVPGLLMFFADGGIKKINIVGPQGVLHSLAAMRLYTYRENMSVDSTEVESSTPITGDQVPSPTYVDQNITLYSIPIHPEVSSSSSALSKRKREVSPASSSKRSATSNHETSQSINATSEENSTPSLPLLERMRLPGFSPTNLRDEEAQKWRRLTIEHMFPWKEPPFVPSKSKAGKGKQVVNGTETQESESQLATRPPAQQQTANNLPYISRKGPQSFNPSGCEKQLPKFDYKEADQTVPATQKPTLAHILVGPKTRGKFDAKKAQALGLEGKLRGKVANGNTVTFLVDDGRGGRVERSVKPEDCVGPSEIPGALIILDIPSREYIPALFSSFTSSRFFSKFRSQLEHDCKEYAVNTVFHLCGDGVLEDEKYKEFIRGFSLGTHHIVSSREYSPDPVTFTQAAFNQLRLNMLDPEMFRLPNFALTPRKELKDVLDMPSNVSLLLPNTLIEMRPPRPPKLDPLVEVDPFHKAMSSSTPVVLPSITLDKFAHTQRLVEITKNTPSPSLPGDDVRILPLGTSSALPSKYRNVSGNLIMIPRWGNILLEAGEGTWGQLARYFGTSSDSEASAWNMLRGIKCIFVSHAHGDHHIGLAKILAMRKKLDPPPSEPLYLVTINSIHVGLREMSDIEDLGIDSNPDNNGVIPIHSTALHYRADADSRTEPQRRAQITIQNMCRALGLRHMSTVDVWHRTQCFGVVIDHQDGWSIVFSGDTQPTDKLVEAGQNATLLIHEATMADDQVEMARAKAHSTVGQAINIGKKMNAENILLTHFSARYPKMPPSITDIPRGQSPESDRKDPTVGLAFDHANIRLGEFWKLNTYLPAIEQSFADTAEEGDNEQIGLDIEW